MHHLGLKWPEKRPRNCVVGCRGRRSPVSVVGGQCGALWDHECGVRRLFLAHTWVPPGRHLIVPTLLLVSHPNYPNRSGQAPAVRSRNIHTSSATRSHGSPRGVPHWDPQMVTHTDCDPVPRHARQSTLSSYTYRGELQMCCTEQPTYTVPRRQPTTGATSMDFKTPLDPGGGRPSHPISDLPFHLKQQ